MLGALAVAAPIWLHLRRKRETNLLQFSALRFLDDQPQPQQSPLRLRNLLLFAVRVLALLLIVAAFAWPYLRGASTAPIKESRVYILDNTLSHQANDGSARDRESILSELKQAGANIQIAVVELAANPKVLVAFGEDRESAKQKLKNLEPSFQRGSYLAAFRQANSLLANSLGVEKRIIFLSDNQQNQWEENTDSPPFLRNVQIEPSSTSVTQLPNISLSEPRAQRVFLGDKSLVNFTVKLTHAGEARTANLVLRVNDQVILNRALDLDKQPDTILIQGQWEAEPGAWLRGEAAVEGLPEALAADNRVFFSLPPVVEGKVALLAQSPYLRLALSPEVMRGEWATRLLDPAHLGREETAMPSPEAAQGDTRSPSAAPPSSEPEVLCIESNYLQSSDARKLLWRYLSNGRGVILLVNRLTPSIVGYLRELGFEAEGEVTSAAAEKFQYVFSNHPIFHPFLSPEYGNLMDIKVSRYARLKSTHAMPLIFSEKGSPLFFQGTKSQGKLFVIAFGLDRDHTSWPIHQTFIPFLDLALQAARAEDPTPTTYEPGDVAQVQSSTSHGRELVLREGQTELARAPLQQGRAQLHLPDKPGLYTVTCDGSTQVERTLSVNPSPKESQLLYVSTPEALQNWQLSRSVQSASALGFAASGKGSRIAILQQHLWWWMLLAGLLALMLEMTLVAARTNK